MKNYYDELEVSKTASKEVIEKVYKVLAKKYHPDMNSGTDKTVAEEKFKKISEAYEILSDDEKRKKYDLELENSEKTVSYDEYLKIINEKNAIANRLNTLQNAVNEYNRQLQNRQNINQTTRTMQPQYTYSSRQQLSKFEIFKRKMKKRFENLFIFILLIIVIILMINSFLNYNIFSIFIQ